MKIKHRYLTWDSRLKIIKPVMSILDKYSHIYKYKEDLDCVIPTFKYQIEFYLYEDNPDFRAIKRELSKFLEPQVIGTEYEKVDTDNAEWFIINTGEYQYPQPETNFGYLQTTFNLDNYCPHCAIGKVQNAPFRLKSGPKQHNNQFWGLHWEFEPIFVRPETKSILEKENFLGISFSKPVLDKKKTELENLFQLHIGIVLPRAFDSYNAKSITCKLKNEENCNSDTTKIYCGRIKYHHPMIGGYCFEKSAFNEKADFVQSHEYFGSGGSAGRLQIVSKRIKNLVQSNKLKGLSFIPIMHERHQR